MVRGAAGPVADITFISLAAQLVPVTGARHVVHHVAVAVPTIALPEARDALSRAGGRWADLLRSLPDTHATIPGSRWTVGDAAAHVVMDVRTEALVAAGEAVSWAEDATSAPGTPRGAAICCPFQACASACRRHVKTDPVPAGSGSVFGCR
jgi:hypothetical protein